MRFPGRLKALIAAIAACCGLASPAHSQSNNVSVSLVAETNLPTPESTFKVALRFTPRPGWHVYWENPGDSGMPPSVTWVFPSGFKAGELRHPAPVAMEAAGFVSYVHEGPVALLTEIHVPASASVGQDIPIIANVRYLACSDTLCVPETGTARAWLTISDNRSARTNSFGTFERALPRILSHEGSFKRVGDNIEIRIQASGGADGARLFALTNGFFKASAEQRIREEDGEIIFTMKASGATEPARFEGIITSRRHPRGFAFSAARAAPLLADVAVSTSSSKITAPVASSSADETQETPKQLAVDLSETPETAVSNAVTATTIVPSQTAAIPTDPSPSASLLPALIAALIGGLLLNLMPCVFPILSLKALSLAKSGESESIARKEGIAYTAGSVATCLALGSALLALRAAGSEIGWSFQLQNPTMIFILLIIVTAIGLNLAGIFELGHLGFGSRLATKKGPAGAFFTGALAAFVATPCSGPFMGAALGATLFLPVPSALAVFAGLGFGMALPFLLLGLIPALRTRLPRPGAWMNRLRRVLSVPMFLTAFGLIWLLSRQTGLNGAALSLLGALLAAVGLIWSGRLQKASRRFAWAPAAAFCLVAFVASAGLPQSNAQASTSADQTNALVRPFSEETLAELRAEGRPVFVDFTADWCITCKVNESVAIHTDRTQAAFASAGVVTLVGDWTNGDPAITRFLAEHGRNSIPFYLFYAPGAEPRVLPQILTPALLEEIATAPSDT